MFQFPACAPTFVGTAHLCTVGCPIRKSPDRRSFAPPRGLSQLITSFIAAKSQGIPCAPLVTYSFLLVLIFFFAPGPDFRPPDASFFFFQSVKELHGISSRTWRITDSNR